ncbi:MAG TPA: prepilin peptidase [Acidimicrobiales bacterium]|nr:prepilin peptidase [Acidimicrobiales bacterium]
MTAVVAVLSGIIGLCVGSFLNVVIHRVPLRQSVVRPRSHCPQCGTQIDERDNIPLVSWIALRGRCRSCHARIPVRYPLVEAATAVLFVAAAVRLGANWDLPAFCVFFASLLAISVIDLERYIIPSRIIYPTLVVVGPLLVLAAALDSRWRALADAGIGGAAAFAALFVVHVISPRGMGFGDVRLAGVIGLMLGWLGLRYVPLGLFLAFVLASVVGIGLMVARLRSRKDAVPFGPFMAMGAVVAVLWGHPLLRLYLGSRA